MTFEPDWENPFAFFWRFIHNPWKIGALRPSSPQLCRATLRAVAPEQRRSMVELGPGTGVITHYLLEKRDPNCRFLAIEIDPIFHRNLQTRFPDSAIHHGSAAELSLFMERERMTAADAVVSGLPWTLFSEAQCREILQEVAANMAPDGVLVTLCYWHARWLPSGIRLERLLRDYFDQVERTATVWTNVPPIFLYRCSRSRAAAKAVGFSS